MSRNLKLKEIKPPSKVVLLSLALFYFLTNTSVLKFSFLAIHLLLISKGIQMVLADPDWEIDEKKQKWGRGAEGGAIDRKSGGD